MEKAYVEAMLRTRGGEATKGWRGSKLYLEVWMQAFDLAAEENISPWDALLLAVRRRAARVRVCDQLADAALAAVRAEQGEGAGPDDSVKYWLTESRNEERLLTRAAKMAIDAGVAAEMVRRLDVEGRLVTEALVAGLDSLELSPEQRITALTAVHHRIMAIEGRSDPSS
jgi:hypothetical protein